MTKIYLALWADAPSLEAEWDDPTVREDDLQAFATPRVAEVFAELTEAKISELKAKVEKDYQSVFEEPRELSWTDVLVEDAVVEVRRTWYLRDAAVSGSAAALVVCERSLVPLSPFASMTDEQAVAVAASQLTLDQACLVVQNHVGQLFGDFAATWWDGITDWPRLQPETRKRLLRDYMAQERLQVQP